jgi:sugar lactone lactonase YvrE
VRQFVLLIGFVFLAAAAGCGGGSARGPVPSSVASPGTSLAKYQVTVRIDAPKLAGTAGRRRPQYLSAATTQMVIDIHQSGGSIAGYPKTVALTPTSGGCTSTLASTSCQIIVSLAAGNYIAALTAEDASGRALSAAQSIALTVVANAANSIALTLSGIPHELDVASGARAVHGSQNEGLLLYGSAAQAFIVTARDVDGNIIVGPGAPTYAMSVVSGSGWTPSAPPATTPNTFTLTPPGINGAGAVLRVTATYPDTTCTQPGAVCTATFSVKNDIQTLFVANLNGGTVTEYAPPYTGAPTTISLGANSPYALTMDAAGNLFVANQLGNTVSRYAPPYTGTPATISTGVNVPQAVALDAAGNLFVLNYEVTPGNLSFGSVTEYAPPYTATPTTILTPSGPRALTMDAAGHLFVADWGGSVVTVYALPYDGPPTTILSGVNQPLSLAVDAAGNLFVGNYAGGYAGGTVTVYAPPYTGTPTTISTGVSAPRSLTLDAAGNLFVGNHGNNTVTEYVPPYSGAPATISSGVNDPYALTFDGMGNLFVANASGDTVTVYAPPYTGAPTTISTGVKAPFALLFTP